MFYLVSKYFTFLPSINNIGLFYHFFNDYCTISRLFHKLCTTGEQNIYVNILTCSLYRQSYLFNVTVIHFIIIQLLNVCLFCKFKHFLKRFTGFIHYIIRKNYFLRRIFHYICHFFKAYFLHIRAELSVSY